MSTARSFGITVSLTESIKENGYIEKMLEEKMNNTTYIDYYQICAEFDKSMKRHLHIQTWSEKPKRKDHIKDRCFKNWLKDTKGWDWNQDNHAVKVKFAYNNWIQSYCLDNPDKNTKGEIVGEKLPPIGRIEEFYPTEEQQENMQLVAHSKNKEYAVFEIEFKNSTHFKEGKFVKADVGMFLAEKMYVTKDMNPIEDQKRRVQKVNSMYFYFKGKSMPQLLELMMTQSDYKKHIKKMEFLEDNGKIKGVPLQIVDEEPIPEDKPARKIIYDDDGNEDWMSGFQSTVNYTDRQAWMCKQG